VFAHWSASWPVLVGYVLVAGWHLTGLARLRASRASGAGPADGAGRRELRREAVLCQLGLLLVLLALVSPLGYYSGVYIWVRAVQTLLVAVVGPGLVVLGAPWLAFRQPWRPGSSQPTAGRADRVPFWASRPAVAVIAFNIVFAGWQLPYLCDLANANSAVALAEHASFVAAGLLLWLQLISSRPFTARGTPLRRVVFVIWTVGVSTVLGMVLVFGNNVLYPVYANSAHHVMTVVDDQQLSGAVLWMGMLPPLITAAVALLSQWLDNEESAELSAGLNRLTGARRRGWPSRPVIR
jgi:cytochrome c oxidase assembly factor CtaG